MTPSSAPTSAAAGSVIQNGYKLLAFVTLFPYVIEAGLLALLGAQRYASLLFAVNYSAFGLVMIAFLMFEPLGLVGIWRRLQNYFLLWPFKYRPVAGTRR